MPKIGIITINNGRPHILKLWLLSIARLRNDVGYFPVVCVSGGEDRKPCEKAGIHHITQDNFPASDKWNTAAKWMLTQDVEYVMIVGSDDIISTDLMRNMISAIDKGFDVYGINEVYFYGSFGKHRGTLLRLQTQKMLGVCKTIRRDIIEKLQGNICTNKKNWAMDASITKNISAHAKTSMLIKGMVVDVKSPKNLNSITFWISKLKEKQSAKLFYSFLSSAERSQLNHLNISG